MPTRLIHRLAVAAQRGLAASWLALAVVAPVACAAVAGCSTPSVPLPPPTVDVTALTFTQSAPNEIVMKGIARPSHAHAIFYIFDQQTGDGVIATAAADGSFTAPGLGFTVGGVAEIYFVQTDGVRSESTCVTVEIGQPLFGATCQ